MFPLPLFAKASTNRLAAAISAPQPFLPKLPLPSRRRTTSRDLLQANGRSSKGVWHRTMLHFLYCKRLVDHAPAHLPAPSGSCLMNFCLFLVPPSQSLEHLDHFVHALSSQSFSQA